MITPETGCPCPHKDHLCQPHSHTRQNRMSAWGCTMHEHGVVDQPPPIHNDSTPIVDLVVEDMIERKRIGTERYGTPLQAHNGRDALMDAYQEALDLVMYLRQAIKERDG